MQLIPLVPVHLNDPHLPLKIQALKRAVNELRIPQIGLELQLRTKRDVQTIAENNSFLTGLSEELTNLGLQPHIRIRIIDRSFDCATWGPLLKKISRNNIKGITIPPDAELSLRDYWTYRKGMPFDYEDKVQLLRKISAQLRKLSSQVNLSVENRALRSTKQFTSVVGHYPYEFLDHFIPAGCGVTLNTSAMGIHIEACRKFAGGYRIEGYFSEELPQAHEVADNAGGAFMALAPHTKSFILGVNRGLGGQGHSPGTPGTLSLEEYKYFLRAYLAAGEGEAGATLIIREGVTTYTMLKTLREFY